MSRRRFFFGFIGELWEWRGVEVGGEGVNGVRGKTEGWCMDTGVEELGKRV